MFRCDSRGSRRSFLLFPTHLSLLFLCIDLFNYRFFAATTCRLLPLHEKVGAISLGKWHTLLHLILTTHVLTADPFIDREKRKENSPLAVERKSVSCNYVIGASFVNECRFSCRKLVETDDFLNLFLYSFLRPSLTGTASPLGEARP